jgi:DNA-binding CsgD family transcriptional regulator
VIEYELRDGRMVGILRVAGRAPVPFNGIVQLERELAAGDGGSGSADRPPRDRNATALNPTERAIAEAAADGATNREIADALHYSVKTVEANLTRVYRKLGVNGRGQLEPLLAQPLSAGR